MKSPFPGMDPYLEQHWRDVHHSLCTYARDALQPQVRPALLARIKERLIIERPGLSSDRSIYPDVKLVEHRPYLQTQGASAAVAELDEPTVCSTLSEQPTEGYIEIIDPSTGGRLVTVIEFLSISNKTVGQARQLYQQKQTELRDAGVSLVEIDLLRGGEWIMQLAPNWVPPPCRGPYRICVRRGSNTIDHEMYPISLDRRLPNIRIPLREGDADARLNLQALIDQTYANGAYEDVIDYRAAAVPPLEGEEAAWAESLLKEQKRR